MHVFTVILIFLVVEFVVRKKKIISIMRMKLILYNISNVSQNSLLI